MANIVEIVVNARDKASKEIREIADELEDIGKRGAKASTVISAVTSAVAGLVTTSAPAVAGVGALASSFAAAGVGAVAFGAVAASAIGQVIEKSNEIAKIEEKIANADTAKERAAAQKELEQAMAGVSKAQKQALTDLIEFKGWWKGFVKEFETPSLKMFSEGLKLVQNTMNALKPAIQSVSQVLVGFMEGLNNSFKTDQVQGFFEYFNKYAGSSLQAILTTTSNLFVGFMEILIAFAPLMDEVNNGMIRASAAFRAWAEGLSSSQGFQTFVEYVKANTPVVLSLFGNLFATLGNLIVILAPLGSVVVSVLNQIMGSLKTFTAALREAFSTGNFAAIGTALTTLLYQIATTLLAQLPQFILIGGQVVTSIAQGLASSAPQLTTYLLTLLSNIITNMAAVYPQVVMAGMQILTSLLQGIITAVPTLLSTISSVITSLMFTLQSVITTYLPIILQLGTQLLLQLINGIVQNLPTLIATATSMITTITNTIITLIPTILQMGIQILTALINGISQMLPMLLTAAVQIVTTLLTQIVNNLPKIIDAGVKLINALVNGLSKTIPKLVPVAIDAVEKLLDAILDNLPQIIDAGVELLLALIDGIIKMLPMLVQTAITLIIRLSAALIAHLPQIIAAGIQIITALVSGIIRAIPQILAAIPKIFSAAVSAFKSQNWSSIGSDIIKGIGKGISSMAGWIQGKISSMAKGLLSKAKGVLGIHSPSREFSKQVGRWIPAGIGTGIEKYGKTAIGALGTVTSDLLSTASGVGKEVSTDLGLDFFTGGNKKVTIQVVHSHEGTIEVEGSGSTQEVDMAADSVKTQTETMDLSDLRQVVRAY
ncbi:tape measure protein [Bacillus phage 268TH004]|uniref:Tape measure protein n=2 Tax=Gettysburgvirus TaxID=3425034 RepID=A0A7T7ZAP2_9CAUD|nr:tape measure protein [Bacillus phage 019DV002]QFG05255.1 tape measure protein [Bacillus phage 019DV004]QFG05868.1 tape measure protein [Bacillus phage 276BB001]QFG05949.1 tape measure protein [Bacillus phage 280BB001]QQO40373.1 tape measure protein [Bacillus phage 268TH004]QZA70098.1 hypothetical protein 274BB002_29 [Bacillus phage 274BB002]